MTAIEYYRKFMDLSRYHPDVAANPVVMLLCFKLSTKKSNVLWRPLPIVILTISFTRFC